MTLSIWINAGIIVLFLIVSYMGVRASDRRRDRWPVTEQERRRHMEFEARAEEICREILSQRFGPVRVRVKQHRLGDIDPRHLTVDGMVDAYRERLAEEFPDVPAILRIRRQIAFEDVVVAQINPPVGSLESAWAIDEALKNFTKENEREARRKIIRSIPRYIIGVLVVIAGWIAIGGLVIFSYRPDIFGETLSEVVLFISSVSFILGFIKVDSALRRYAEDKTNAKFLRYIYDIENAPAED